MDQSENYTYEQVADMYEEIDRRSLANNGSTMSAADTDAFLVQAREMARSLFEEIVTDTPRGGQREYVAKFCAGVQEGTIKGPFLVAATSIDTMLLSGYNSCKLAESESLISNRAPQTGLPSSRGYAEELAEVQSAFEEIEAIAEEDGADQVVQIALETLCPQYR